MVRRYKKERILVNYVAYVDGEPYQLSGVRVVEKAILGFSDIKEDEKRTASYIAKDRGYDKSEVKVIMTNISPLRTMGK